VCGALGDLEQHEVKAGGSSFKGPVIERVEPAPVKCVARGTSICKADALD